MIYLSGPMSGYVDNNYPAFHAAAARLRALGHEVLNPAELTRPDDTYETCMRVDIREMLKDGVDTIAMLPRWEHSRGAQAEIAMAQLVGMKIIDVDTLEPIRIQAHLHIQVLPPHPLDNITIRSTMA